MNRSKPNYSQVDRIQVDRTPLTEELKEELKRKEKKKKNRKIIKWLLGLNIVAVILFIIEVILHGKKEFTNKDQVEEWLLELDYPEDEIDDFMENEYDPNIDIEEYAIAIENSVSVDDIKNFL